MNERTCVNEQFFRERSKVNPNGCWIWLRSRGPTGYGCLRREGKTRIAHRFSFEYFIGPIAEGLCVLHSCDTPSCINPAHLFLGTQAENMADKTRKGRQLKGEQHPGARMTEEIVREIRAAVGCSSRELSEKYGISEEPIRRARLRLNWKHVE